MWQILIGFNGDWLSQILPPDTKAANELYVQAFGIANSDDTGVQIITTQDGGSLTVGATYKSDSNTNLLVSKFDASGELSWSKSFGRTRGDYAYSATQDKEWNYAITGIINSDDAAYGTVWYDGLVLIKLDPNGNLLFNKKIVNNENGGDYGKSIIAINDGYIITGYTNTFGNGGNNLWLIKFDFNGNLIWTKTVGESNKVDIWEQVIQTSDGGFATIGWTYSYTSAQALFLLKFNSDGSLVQTSSKVISLAPEIDGRAFQQTADGGFILTGHTHISNKEAIVVIKLTNDGSLQWVKTFGWTGGNLPIAIKQTSDTGYILAGYTNSYGAGGYDVFLMKLDKIGDVQWMKTIGWTSSEYGYSVAITSQGEYLATGTTDGYGKGLFDLMTLKFDQNGNCASGCSAVKDVVLSQIIQGDGGSVTVTSPTFTTASITPQIATIDNLNIDASFTGLQKTQICSGAPAPANTKPNNPLLHHLYNGEITTDNTPSVQFDLSDPDSGDKIKYLIEIANNLDFTSTSIVDGITESAYLAGPRNNVVYTPTATLPDGRYYWRVKAKDEGGLESDWTVANGWFLVNTIITPMAPFATAVGTVNNDYSYDLENTSDGEYIATGYTGTGTTQDLLLIKYSNDGKVGWRTFGSATTAKKEIGYKVKEISDGYVITGQSQTDLGNNAIWVLKVDSEGNLKWDQSLALNNYIGWAATEMNRNNNEKRIIVTSYPWTWTPSASASIIAQLDSNTGEIKTVNKLSIDWGDKISGIRLIANTNDGGYMLVGHGYLDTNDSNNSDMLLLKYSQTDQLEWARKLGGNKDPYGGTTYARSDLGTFVQQTTDGGYIMSGLTYSLAKPNTQNKADLIVAKLDKDGAVTWAKTAGTGDFDDDASAVRQTSDGGYIIAGKTASYDSTDSASPFYDVWLLKFNATGGAQWVKTIGGAGQDEKGGRGLTITADGGYVVSGMTKSYGSGGEDVLLVKFNADGTCMQNCMAVKNREITTAGLTDATAALSATNTLVTSRLTQIAVNPSVFITTPVKNILGLTVKNICEAAPTCTLKGDVDCSGTVTQTDLTLVRAKIVGNTTPDTTNFVNGDVSSCTPSATGLNANDAAMYRAYIVN